MTKTFDPRLTPARPDLAAAHLKGSIEAASYTPGRAMHVSAGIADLRRSPGSDSPLDTQLLHGENVMLYEDHEGWGWVQLTRDHYVGYVAMIALANDEAKTTHRVSANRTFVYPGPDIKLPPLAALPLGAEISVAEDKGRFVRLVESGFVFADHIRPREDLASDFVAIAERFLATSYLWGGKTSLGIDCSGLVQISLAEAGIAAPRDTDLQEQTLGTGLPVDELHDLRRGDLVFWKGHVGIMRDATELLHANAHHMLVASEPLVKARDRILRNGSQRITSIRRL
jgi:cell wall-associated NlpC family hydrolase